MEKTAGRVRLQGVIPLYLMIFSMLFLIVAEGKAADLSADYPSRPIEFVTHNPPGGSNDITARTVSDINRETKILSQPFVVVNKPGGAGTIARSYVFERSGNPHMILIIGSNGYINTMLLEKDKIPYNYKSFVPICNLGVEGVALMVRSDSPFKTADDLIAEARKRPKELIQGGGSFTSNDNMIGKQIQNRKGVQWKFISFAGGEGEALLNVLSGNVNFAFTSVGGARDFVLGGKMRALFVCTPNRYPYPELKNVPTMVEAGMGEPIMSYRGIVGPPNMPDYAAKKLDVAFKKFMEHDRFKKLIEDSAMLPFYLPSAEYGKLLDKLNDESKILLADLGLFKKK